jgi:hypothetical protein
MAFLAGWGITNITTMQTAKKLKYLQVMVKHPVYCKAHWKDVFDLKSNICAGGNVMYQSGCKVQ